MGILGFNKLLISSVHSAEVGSLTRVVKYMIPNGHFMSLFPVFSRKRLKPELINCTPPEKPHACHQSEWIKSEIFVKWFLLSFNLKSQ
jgi:hypothetical protein